MTYGSILVAVIAANSPDPTPEIWRVLKDRFGSVGRIETLHEELPNAEAIQALRDLQDNPSELLRFYAAGKKNVIH